ncbi:hypothetical protein B0H17DRAFT_1213987 [Mycena rosella]|uniref:Uncharacterized protein n=1 Tax=Mycena rosella TaxID=1033263 RepID=A0AAD7CP09_MYCRO|nr:hypothetical protein B0H17DRAFT_1213987 [Mycena rosella]
MSQRKMTEQLSKHESDRIFAVLRAQKANKGGKAPVCISAIWARAQRGGAAAYPSEPAARHSRLRAPAAFPLVAAPPHRHPACAVRSLPLPSTYLIAPPSFLLLSTHPRLRAGRRSSFALLSSCHSPPIASSYPGWMHPPVFPHSATALPPSALFLTFRSELRWRTFTIPIPYPRHLLPPSSLPALARVRLHGPLAFLIPYPHFVLGPVTYTRLTPLPSDSRHRRTPTSPLVIVASSPPLLVPVCLCVPASFIVIYTPHLSITSRHVPSRPQGHRVSTVHRPSPGPRGPTALLPSQCYNMTRDRVTSSSFKRHVSSLFSTKSSPTPSHQALLMSTSAYLKPSSLHRPRSLTPGLLCVDADPQHAVDARTTQPTRAPRSRRAHHATRLTRPDPPGQGCVFRARTGTVGDGDAPAAPGRTMRARGGCGVVCQGRRAWWGLAGRVRRVWGVGANAALRLLCQDDLDLPLFAGRGLRVVGAGCDAHAP